MSLLVLSNKYQKGTFSLTGLTGLNNLNDLATLTYLTCVAYIIILHNPFVVNAF